MPIQAAPALCLAIGNYHCPLRRPLIGKSECKGIGGFRLTEKMQRAADSHPLKSSFQVLLIKVHGLNSTLNDISAATVEWVSAPEDI